MIRSTSSPAISEISVGSPSPPPAPPPATTLAFHCTIKDATTNTVKCSQNQLLPQPKSKGERIKSFSIADILGKKEEPQQQHSEESTELPKASPQTPVLSTFTFSSKQSINDHLPPSAKQTLMLDAVPTILNKVSNPWDHLGAAPLALHPLFPQSLLHYEQRLAWDYQRQLQEHFQAQAQLLREINLDPSIITSEDDSERSQSSSTENEEISIRSYADDGDDKTQNTVCSENKNPVKHTPLDALFQLSTKNFDEEQDPATLNIFATRSNAKKKRKSRTAFTNHQIFELEKRFLYQKYLSPADRDDIAASLGLSNAQVITWFQNRRAKLKRDMEELKKDVESVKQLSAHKSFLENVNDLSILKTRPASRNQKQPHEPTAVHVEPAHNSRTTIATTTIPVSIATETTSVSFSFNLSTQTSPTKTTPIGIEIAEGISVSRESGQTRYQHSTASNRG